MSKFVNPFKVNSFGPSLELKSKQKKVDYSDQGKWKNVLTDILIRKRIKKKQGPPKDNLLLPSFEINIEESKKKAAYQTTKEELPQVIKTEIIDKASLKVEEKIRQSKIIIQKTQDYLADDADHSSRKRLYDTLIDQALVNFLPSEADECTEIFRVICSQGKHRLTFQRFRTILHKTGHGVEQIAADDLFMDRFFNVACKHDDYTRHYAGSGKELVDEPEDDDNEDEGGDDDRRRKVNRKKKRSQMSLLAYVTTLAIVARGSMKEKLQLCYELFDLDGDGIISSHDVFCSLQTLFDSPIRGDLELLYAAVSAKGEKIKQRILRNADNTLNDKAEENDSDDGEDDQAHHKGVDMQASNDLNANTQAKNNVKKFAVTISLTEFIDLFKRIDKKRVVKSRKERRHSQFGEGSVKKGELPRGRRLSIFDNNDDENNADRFGKDVQNAVIDDDPDATDDPKQKRRLSFSLLSGQQRKSVNIDEANAAILAGMSTKTEQNKFQLEIDRKKARAAVAFDQMSKMFAAAANASQLREHEIRNILEDCADLISEGYLDMNTPFTPTKSTFLHTAVWYRLTSLVSLLLEYGANPNAKNLKGNSPLHLGCEIGHKTDGTEVIGALLSANGTLRNPHLFNHAKKTPLSMVQSKHVEEFIKDWRAGAKDEDLFENSHQQPKLVDVLAYALYYQYKNKVRTRVTLASGASNTLSRNNSRTRVDSPDKGLSTAGIGESKKISNYRRATSSSSFKTSAVILGDDSAVWVQKRKLQLQRVISIKSKLQQDFSQFERNIISLQPLEVSARRESKIASENAALTYLRRLSNRSDRSAGSRPSSRPPSPVPGATADSLSPHYSPSETSSSNTTHAPPKNWKQMSVNIPHSRHASDDLQENNSGISDHAQNIRKLNENLHSLNIQPSAVSILQSNTMKRNNGIMPTIGSGFSNTKSSMNASMYGHGLITNRPVVVKAPPPLFSPTGLTPFVGNQTPKTFAFPGAVIKSSSEGKMNQ